MEEFKDKTDNNQKKWIAVVSILLFICCSFLLGRMPLLTKAIDSPIFHDPRILQGILTQIQLMISVYLVLYLRRRGYVVATLLNTFGISIAVLYMVLMKSAGSMPGLASYLVAILLVNLVASFQKQEGQFVQKIKKQKEELEESEKHLYAQAYYDSLTELPNREFFMGSLEMEIHRSIRKNMKLGVLFIDLDSFKMVNDTLGHTAGDKILIQVADRFGEVVTGQVICRSGGDEFYAMVSNIEDLKQAEEVADEIRSVFLKPFHVGEVEFFLSVSIGIAMFPYDGDSGAELIKKADLAMYEAKKRGKDQYAVYNMALEETLVRKTTLSNCLYRALGNQELSIDYQPQIRLRDGKIIGLEALMRWKHPKWGDISPGEFIPLAEQNALIRPIGLWAFETACLQSMKLKELADHPIRMSVNFSLEQLRDENLTGSITRIIQKTKVNPEDIVIEITEGTAFHADYPIIGKLKELKELGLLVALDDFGKEYSSLNRIRSFPVDILKIDMDFVHGITKGNEKDRAIVKTMIQLAGNLGIHVIAEGVEEKEQLQFLEQEGCQEVQGFYFYPGLTALEMEKLLTGSS